MTEKRLSLGACVSYYVMAPFIIRRMGTLSLTGKKYKIQAAQKNTELNVQETQEERGAKRKTKTEIYKEEDERTKITTNSNSTAVRKAVAQI